MVTTTILVIDDTLMIRRMTALLFQRQGFQVISAEGGRAALAILKNMVVDVITLDLMMPEMSGLEFLKIIKSDPKLKDIPVIVISSVGVDATIEQAKKLGAFYALSKPFSSPQLMEAVTRALNKEPGAQHVSVDE